MAKNSELISMVEQKYSTNKEADVMVGDQLDVHVRVKEGGKERVQIFSGVCIAVSGHGIRKTFTVRRMIGQYGVERKFPFQSPKIAEVVVRKRGVIRRAKLFYLRERLGMSARIAEKQAHKTEEGGSTEGGAPAQEAKPRKAAKQAKRQPAEAATAKA